MSLNSFGALISPACEVGVLPRLLRITDTVYLLGGHFGCFRGSVWSRLPSMSRFKPQLDKPKDRFGPCRFVALFSCPGVHTFTQFGRKTDGRYGIMSGGATAFLCTRGHMLPFLFTFIIYRSSGHLQSPRRRRDPGTSRSVCSMGCSCPMCRTRLRTPSTAVSQSDVSEWPEARASARSARIS